MSDSKRDVTCSGHISKRCLWGYSHNRQFEKAAALLVVMGPSS